VTVEGDALHRLLARTLNKMAGLYKHTAGTTGRIEDDAVVGLDNVDDGLHDGRRGEELTIVVRSLLGKLTAAQAMEKTDREAFIKDAKAQAANWVKGRDRDNAALHKSRKALQSITERCRDLTKQIDLAVKLAGRVIETAFKECDAKDSELWANGEINKARKALETARAEVVEALRQTRYFIKQADWLQERFPKAKLQPVVGLVTLVSRAEIGAHDWSLTPGRYVGVAPEEVDKDFDFEEALRSIHIDLKGLNEEAVQLAARIAKNFEELGA